MLARASRIAATAVMAAGILASTASATITYESQWGSQGGDYAFEGPGGTARDSAGNVYVTDGASVKKFDASGTFITKWGTFGSGDGQFNSATGIAVDSADNVYVADTNNSRIQKFSSSGTYLDQWSINTPVGIAVDSSDNVYAADINASVVSKFDSSGTPITSWGSGGTAEGQFNTPVGMATDSSDNVYVVDVANHRVQEFDSSGAFVRMWGWGVDDGTSALQTCTSSCQAGIQGSNDGQLRYPEYLAIDSSGNVYVADSENQRIQEFDASTATVSFTRKWGTAGSGDGQFNFPLGLAIGSGGDVYVADHTNNRIQEFTSSGTFVRKWGYRLGTADGELAQPLGVATSPGGDVYVADWGNDRIQQFDSSGAFVRKWDATGAVAVAVGPSGNVYVAEDSMNRVEEFSSTGAFVGRWGANGGDGTSGSGNGDFTSPQGIATDSSGHVYVSDTQNDRVQEFTANGAFIRKWGTSGSGNGQFAFPIGVATDTTGHLFVADVNNSRVQEFSSTGAFIRKWGASGSGDGEFARPTGVATDTSGNVYVTDSIDDRIQKFTPTGAFISKFGSAGAGDGEFDSLQGIATYSSTGTIYVADEQNYRIQKLSEDMTPPAGGVITSTYPAFRLATPVGVSWGGATDSGSGIKNYMAYSSRALFSGGFRFPMLFKTTAGPGSGSFNGLPGNTYCFTVRVKDNAGNTSGASPQKCTALPVDDRLLTGSGWIRASGEPGYYRGTFSQTQAQGATLTRTGVQAKRIVLVATKCPGCGVVEVSQGGIVLKKVNLAAATTQKRQIIPVANFGGVHAATVKTKVLSSGKPVIIDGLGASRN